MNRSIGNSSSAASAAAAARPWPATTHRPHRALDERGRRRDPALLRAARGRRPRLRHGRRAGPARGRARGELERRGVEVLYAIHPDCTWTPGAQCGRRRVPPRRHSTPTIPRTLTARRRSSPPPYLFKGGRRPAITSAPTSVRYGQSFEVGTPDAADIATVSWIRLPSVTHSFDQNQRINFLRFTSDGPDTLSVTAPDTPQLCPPGTTCCSSSMRKAFRRKPPSSGSNRSSKKPHPQRSREGLAAAPAPETAEDYGLRCSAGRRSGNAGGHRHHRNVPLWDRGVLGRRLRRVGPARRCGVCQPRPGHRGFAAQVFLVDDRLPNLRSGSEQWHAGISTGTTNTRGCVEVTVARLHLSGRRAVLSRRRRPPSARPARSPYQEDPWDHLARSLKPRQPPGDPRLRRPDHPVPACRG